MIDSESVEETEVAEGEWELTWRKCMLGSGFWPVERKAQFKEPACSVPINSQYNV